MDFRLGDEAEAFRGDVRAFLAENLTDQIFDRMEETGTHSDPAFAQAIGAKGWIASNWSKAEGGGSRTWADHAVLRDEFREAEAPVDGVFTTMLIAATLKQFGTPEQKANIMEPAVRGEVIISVGYTEADSGSDASAARTSAVRDGDEWVINGEKMFTTLAHIADYVFVLTRTNPHAEKHQGLTTFLVPTANTGFSVTGLETISGERTNITTYQNVRVPDSLRVGEVDDGWGVANAALELEHSSTFAGSIRHVLTVAIEEAQAEDDEGKRLMDDPTVRARIGEVAIELEVSELLGLRASWLHSIGEPNVVEGSMSKLYSSEALARCCAVLLDIFGNAALRRTRGVGDESIGAIEYAYRHSQITRIYAGTSEIQRGIIANRGLGLPRTRSRGS